MESSLEYLINIINFNNDAWQQAAVIVLSAVIGAFIAFIRSFYKQILISNHVAHISIVFVLTTLLFDIMGAGLASFILIPAFIRQEFVIPAAFLLGFSWSYILRSLSKKISVQLGNNLKENDVKK